MTDLAALDARIAALEAEAEQALTTASATALGGPSPAGFRLTTCAEWRAIQQELAPLRAARGSASPARSAPAVPKAAPMPAPTPTRTREEKIRAIAAGFPEPVPAAMVDAAIDRDMTVEAFAVAAADYAAGEAKARAHEIAVSDAAARILGHVPAARRAPSPCPTDTRSLEQAVADILAA